MAKPLVELIFSAFCVEEAPAVRRLARQYGFPLREYDIWEVNQEDKSLPAHIRRKVALVRSGEEGFFAGACFIDGREVDWWAGFERDFRMAAAREKTSG